MSIFDVLFGRTKPVRSRQEQFFSIATATPTLETSEGLKATGRGGLALRPMSNSGFREAEGEMEQLVRAGARESISRLGFAKDDYGYLWVIVEDEQFEDMVSLLYSASVALTDNGYGDQILAAIVEFSQEAGKKVFWIYNFKRATFYPFVPADGKGRDNAYELRLAAVMKKELPIEPEPSHWYALWGAPLDAARSGG
ncbi:MAG: hypothetical protein HY677_03055 [Chloroflexi bacterium]|nr:hypothetical protein [Chloroflexota bacterium]